MKSESYSILDKYVLRAPILSNDTLSNISSEKIRNLCKRPVVSEAIYLASPELHEEMQKFLKDTEYDNPRLEFSLLKYISRMSYRCTPFGLFAGITVGKISEETNVELSNVSEYKRVTRLDMNYLCSLVQELESIPDVRNNLLYSPNNSLYKVGSKYRYIEYQYNNSIRQHYIIAIDASLYVGKVLKLAEKGARIKDLAAAIVSSEISMEDARVFINNLIDNQILLSAISPTVSGDDYLEHIHKKTGISWLQQIGELLHGLDRSVIHDNIKQYQDIIHFLRQLEVPFNKKFLFQTDLLLETQTNELNHDLAKDIEAGIKALNKLAKRKKNSKLEEFKKAFQERYEDEEVPLSIALDVETGIGYNQSHKGTHDVCPLIDDLLISNDSNFPETTVSHQYILEQIDSLITQKFTTAKSKGAYEIEFTDEDLKSLEERWNDLPATFPVTCSLFQDDKSPIITITDIGGPSASCLLGRFSHTNNEIKEILSEIVQKEEGDVKDDRVLAEIVHLPEARTGNILYRNSVRKHEIAYLAKSNLPLDQQLHITDLHLSIQNNKLVLRSKKLNSYIEPRMANAHNYEDSPLPIYQFLGDMQTQDLRSTLSFAWGDNLLLETFYPRVKYKNIILSAARWRIKREELKKLTDFSSIQKWQKRFKIPSTFLVTDYDNELLVNLENEMSCNMFIAEIRNKAEILLKEDLYSNFKSIVKKGLKGYNNEFIFSLHR